MLYSWIGDIIDNASVAIWIYDAKGILLFANKESKNFSNSNFTVGSSIFDDIDKSRISESPVPTAIYERRIVSIKLYNIKNKKLFATAIPIFNNKKELTHCMSIVRDISDDILYNNDIIKSEKNISLFLKKINDIELENNEDADDVIAESRQMKSIISLAKQVAPYGSPIIISGPTGVGKNVLAAFIHSRSKRSKSPFITVNCGALPAELIESEFFGHEKGSFTGASGQKRGLFEVANGGTLLLDEISELPFSLQVKLLSVLQECKFRRVGGLVDIPVDVRIIAATNRNLHGLIKQGKFRSDLFYRIATVTIDIPPLSDRKLDLMKFIFYSLDKLNIKYGTHKHLTQACLEVLMAYSWPGNMREVNNVVERIFILSPLSEIGTDVLPENIYQTQLSIKTSLKDALESEEKRILTSAKKLYKTTTKMAEMLGCDNSTISRKLRKYGIDSDGTQDDKSA